MPRLGTATLTSRDRKVSRRLSKRRENYSLCLFSYWGQHMQATFSRFLPPMQGVAVMPYQQHTSMSCHPSFTYRVPQWLTRGGILLANLPCYNQKLGKTPTSTSCLGPFSSNSTVSDSQWPRWVAQGEPSYAPYAGLCHSPGAPPLCIGITLLTPGCTGCQAFPGKLQLVCIPLSDPQLWGSMDFALRLPHWEAASPGYCSKVNLHPSEIQTLLLPSHFRRDYSSVFIGAKWDSFSPSPLKFEVAGSHASTWIFFFQYFRISSW